jgi:3-hydroxyisobutyrate dehydrogenase-like beta-hydroxyacid dehydrogenase
MATVLERVCGFRNGSFFQSPIYENYGKIIIGEKFSLPGFALRLGLEDVRQRLVGGGSVSRRMAAPGTHEGCPHSGEK